MARKTPAAIIGNPTKVYPQSDDFGWRDITGQINVRGVGSNDPTWTVIDAGPLSAFQFALNDECWMAYHMPHDIVKGSDVHLHTHWMVDGTNVQPVRWEWTYSFARGFGQDPYVPAGTTIFAQEAPTGVAWQHMTTESSAITLFALETDAILYTRIRRITNGATDNTDGVFLLTGDVHYQSTDRSTINRAPDFYQ